MSPTVEIALLSVTIALSTTASAAIFAFLNYKREKLNQKIQYATFKQQYFSGLRSWAERLSDLLSEAIHLVELDPAKCEPGEFFKLRNKLRTEVSSMIDRGRWFFPNLKTEEVGQLKAKEFKGYRKEILNSLVASYDALTALDWNDCVKNRPLRQTLVDAKRDFVSQIQDTLSPTDRDQEFLKITNAVALVPSKQTKLPAPF